MFCSVPSGLWIIIYIGIETNIHNITTWCTNQTLSLTYTSLSWCVIEGLSEACVLLKQNLSLYHPNRAPCGYLFRITMKGFWKTRD